MHPVLEHTPGVLSGRPHQSPSRQQRPADPRWESTVLFKGFNASTAETGLLEVDEIAEINGSPELVRGSHSSGSVTKPDTPDPPAAPQSHANPPIQQAASAAHQHRSNDAQVQSTAATSRSIVAAETADHQPHASNSRASSAPAPDLGHSLELGAQQEGCSQSQGLGADVGPRLGVDKQQDMQVCLYAQCLGIMVPRSRES